MHPRFKWLTFLLVPFLFSCNKEFKPTSESQFGKELFNLVTNINATTPDQFKSYFISYENLNYFIRHSKTVTNKWIKENAIQLQDDEAAKREHSNEILESYLELVDFKLDASKCVFVSFEHENITTDEMPIFHGILKFMVNDPVRFKDLKFVYEVKSQSIFTGKFYELLSISEPRRSLSAKDMLNFD